jgi:hypothetical protein
MTLVGEQKVSKTCNSCGRIKPIGDFRKHKGHGDGYDSRCKECMRREQREKRLLKAPEVAKVDPKRVGELAPRYRAMVTPYHRLDEWQRSHPGEVSPTKLVEAAAKAFEDFFNEFTNERLGGLPAHARAWVTAALANPSLLLNVPPRHAKTTIMVVWFTLWQFCCDRNTQVIVVSKTTALGEKISRKLCAEMETNEKLIAAFGRFRPSDLSRPWREAKGELELEGKDLSLRSGDLSLQVRGSGQQVLGMEADWVIADDITDRRVARSETERNSEWDYFLGDVLTRLAPHGKVFCIGQRVHSEDIYGRLARLVDDDGTLAWHQEKTPAILDEESGEVLWPGLWTYERLVKKRKDLGSALFTCMYQQAPEVAGEYVPRWWLEGDGSTAHPGCYDRDRSVGTGWEPDPLDPVQSFIPTTRAILIDPSPTRYAGVVVLDIVYQHRAKFFYAAIVDVERLAPGHGLRGMVECVERLAREHRPQVCIFETNSAKWLREDPAWNRLEHLFKVMPHDTTKWNKNDTQLGVWSLAADFEAGRIRFPYQTPADRAKVQPLIDEILSYPNGQTDDVLMALWFGKANYRFMLPRAFIPTHFQRGHDSSMRTWDVATIAETGRWGRTKEGLRGQEPARP